MNIHEYQAKQLLKQYGVAVPPGEPCTSVDQARAIAPWYAAHPNARAWGVVLREWVQRHAWGLLVCAIASIGTVWAIWIWA